MASSPTPQPDWLILQKKIFNRYVEQRLKEGGIKRSIKDLVEEIQDGALLVDMLQAMSGEQGPKLKEAKMRIQQIQNVGLALEFVKKCGVDLSKIRIQAEDIVDKKEQTVLAMIFQIIIKFLKFEEEEGDDGKKASIDVREALHLWLKNKTAGYAGVEITDFTKCFHSGLPFLALVHKMRPKLVEYHGRTAAMAHSNLEIALDLGEKYLGIPKYLTIADIPKLNEVSMIVYLSDWFSGVTLLQKQDISARRIGKLVDITELHDKLRADYTARASAIDGWAKKKIVELQERKFDDTMAGIKNLLTQFYNFKNHEKAQKLTENLDATSVFDNLQSRLKNHKRPFWNPAAGLSPNEIDATFHALEEQEKKRGEALQTELNRQIRLLKLFRRFQLNAGKLRTWSAEKEAYINSSATINSVEDAEDALDLITVFEGELKHLLSTSLTDLQKLGQELIAERFEKKAEVASTDSQLSELFKGVGNTAQQKKAQYTAALAEQKKINDTLYKAFADAVNDFSGFMKSKRDAINAESKTTLAEQLAFLQSQQGETGAAQTKLASIEAADHKLQARELANNPYTSLTFGDAGAIFSAVNVLLTKKIELLKEQLEEQKRGGLTPEQQKEIQENFTYFDKDSNGFLNRKEFRTCLQSLGEEAKPQDLKRIYAEYNKEGNGNVTRAEFERFMRDSLGDSNTQEEILKAFSFLSYEKDHVLQVELVNVVNNRSFTDHHVEYLAANMPAKGAGKDFTTWTGQVFAR